MRLQINVSEDACAALEKLLCDSPCDPMTKSDWDALDDVREQATYLNEMGEWEE